MSGDKGQEANDQFTHNFFGITVGAAGAIQSAGKAVSDNKDAVTGPAGDVGSGSGTSLADTFTSLAKSGIIGAGATLANAMLILANDPTLIALANSAGRQVGEAVDSGFAVGIDPNRDGFSASQVSAAAKALVDYAKKQINQHAQAASPAKLFIESGQFITQGVAAGLVEPGVLGEIDVAAATVIDRTQKAVNRSLSLATVSAQSAVTRAVQAAAQQIVENQDVITQAGLGGVPVIGERFVGAGFDPTSRQQQAVSSNQDITINVPVTVQVSPDDTPEHVAAVTSAAAQAAIDTVRQDREVLVALRRQGVG